ncbi:1,2-phenylacetyl-CoA epoxidase subunit PaaC [Pollutimonas harenae]|uniref:Phenylacetate-CoA oxygenase subunit PaaC n=1 Tax=Pollutimonas harenae TaxID=657015 RepID=A0A853H1R7_9BURK|nr:1,2-phenylacetyl-CoA epoxidase subunit PaaC [Pollutimonas harenae]NYT85729.1 phenylacetate-CoA oxygenase subunit PaaC [Pollutimonas harenae]TEA70798.1 phenylacetate-CoA oxygenase subunit PaaI [Pollutimonas harenae]
MDQTLFQYSLRMGDTTLILSHRLSEWTGHGPELEEDLAMTNVALDLLGQARMWLTLAGELEGASRDEDQLAYLRDAPQYRNYLLVERDNGHYGHTIARQFLFDAWHYLLLQGLCTSTNEHVAAIAEKSIKEVSYHARRSSDILVRLGDGTAESHARMQDAVNDAWRFCGELFIDDDITLALEGQGVVPAHASLWQPWLNHVALTLAEATLTMPDPDAAVHPAHTGGVYGRHTEALGYLLAEMQHLQRSYPGASW